MENQFTALENFLYVDVGGGSSEITLFMKGKTISSRSFNIGTLRVLENAVNQDTWREMKDWLEALPKLESLAIIGLGGNINKLFKLSLKEAGSPLTQKYLAKQYRILNNMSMDDRILDLDLNPDRADVIVPALEIYLNIMSWAGVTDVYVPKIGLSDGIVRVAYDEWHQPSGKPKRKIVQKSAE
jgi:exopolyphosphatase/guanosine-5'-triphosphate,3'-diphosphate pyrophosphatase